MSPQTLIADSAAHLSAYITRTYGIDHVEVAILPPTDRTKADLVSTIAFSLAKQVKKAPAALLEEFVHELEQFAPWMRVEAALPGFLNFHFTDAYYDLLLAEVLMQKEDWGRGAMLKGETWVVEHTSPNPNKAMHIGHLRNNLIGMSVANILEFVGAKVVRDAVDNNRGIAMAKAMWGYLAFQKKDVSLPTEIAYWSTHKDAWKTPQETGIKSDHFVGECYLKGAEAFKNDPDVEEATRKMVVDWEAKDALTWELWEYILAYAHGGMEETLARLGNRWDHVWHEHEHYQEGKDIVTTGLQSGVFKQLEDGAVLTNLESYGLPDTIVLKSDGTSLYITQDLALTSKKKAFYHADKLIWVIGPEQAMAMKQLFAVCEQLGIGKLTDFTHITYGLVQLVDAEGNAKKMSSRGGETLLIDDLLDDVKEELSQSDRHYAPEVVEKLAVSAVKYSILRTGRTSNVKLNLTSTVSMDGDSGVYILYTLGRINSLLAKQEITTEQETTFEEHEKRLLSHLFYFPYLLEGAARDFSPNLVVDYILTLSQLFNSLYNAERFISEDVAKTNKKLKLCKAASYVYASCLKLLGMEVLERV